MHDYDIDSNLFGFFGYIWPFVFFLLLDNLEEPK